MNYSKKRPVFAITLIISIIILGCSKTLEEKSVVTINGIDIKVEVAQTPQERETGLMNRKKLERDSGMLFVFKEEQRLSFWMKNTSIPLSIAYISKSGEIKEIFDMKPFSRSSIHSKWSVKYALEVNKGFFEKNGIKAGDMVKIEDQYK